jgi:hypothetical protein
MDEDEKAMMLLDRLLQRGARRLPDIEKEFKELGIPGCNGHIRNYGARITRNDVMGTGNRWVYLWQGQRERIIADVAAIRIAMELVDKYANTIVPASHVFHSSIKRRGLKAAIDRALRDMGYYFVGGVWNKSKYYGNAVLTPINNKELEIEDRYWMLGELSWILTQETWELGDLDSKEIWDRYKETLSTCVTFGQLDVWVRIINQWKDIERFMKVESDYGY